MAKAARRGKGSRQAPEVINDRQAEHQDEEENQEGAGGDTLFDNMGEDDYVLVKRRDDRTMKQVTHGKIMPQEATEEFIQARWGGGEFTLQERKRNAAGSYQYGRTRTIYIAGPYKPPVVAVQGDASNTSKEGVSAVSGPGGVEVGTHPSSGEALNTALVATVVDLMKSLRNPPPVPVAPTTDWQPIIIALIPLIQEVLSKLLERKDDGGSVLAARFERIEELLAKANTPQGPASNAIGDAVKAIRELLTVKDMIEGKGSADPESMMFSAIPKLIETMASASKGGQPKVLPPSPQPDVAQAALPMWHRILLGQKATLLRAAQFGMNPTTAAEVAVQMMPPNLVGAITEFLLREDHIAVAKQVIPELQEYAVFTDAFFKEMHALMLAEDDEEGGEDGQQGGP